MRVWRRTRGQIGNRSDPHGKRRRNDAMRGRFLLIGSRFLLSYSPFFAPSKDLPIAFDGIDDASETRYVLPPSRHQLFNLSAEFKRICSAKERVPNTFCLVTYCFPPFSVPSRTTFAPAFRNRVSVGLEALPSAFELSPVIGVSPDDRTALLLRCQ